ncbi:MAG: hypothetical protein K8R74_04055 [Bacteroidales bacterium]|nr:hypothetical protein [Bacteroidales bacterium]
MVLKSKKKYRIINAILFAFLFLSISFNKEYLRPNYGNLPFIGILTGSFPNFIAAYIISLFPLKPILDKNLKYSRIIFYASSFLIFIVFTVEELKPLFGASTQYDPYDIIASGIGSLLAILTFEFFIFKPKNIVKIKY